MKIIRIFSGFKINNFLINKNIIDSKNLIFYNDRHRKLKTIYYLIIRKLKIKKYNSM